MVRPEGIEPPAYRFEACRSIHLSYGRNLFTLNDLQRSVSIVLLSVPQDFSRDSTLQTRSHLNQSAGRWQGLIAERTCIAQRIVRQQRRVAESVLRSEVKASTTPIVAALIAALAVGWVNVRTQEKPLAVIHATVIDATGAAAKPDMTVLISSNRIIAVGKTGMVRVSDDAQLVDATGKFVIPGLWDMHVHLGNYEDGRKTLATLAQSGITGVRDMASPVDDILRLRQETSESGVAGSRMVVRCQLLERTARAAES